jgi:hypothetical protein
VPRRLGKALSLIPFVFHGPRHALPEVDKPPLGDVIGENHLCISELRIKCPCFPSETNSPTRGRLWS